MLPGNGEKEGWKGEHRQQMSCMLYRRLWECCLDLSGESDIYSEEDPMLCPVTDTDPDTSRKVMVFPRADQGGRSHSAGHRPMDQQPDHLRRKPESHEEPAQLPKSHTPEAQNAQSVPNYGLFARKGRAWFKWQSLPGT